MKENISIPLSFQVSFPPSGFLSPEKLDQLAKLLPESEEEPMDATEDYEEVRMKGSLASYPGSRWAGERESLVSTVCACA